MPESIPPNTPNGPDSIYEKANRPQIDPPAIPLSTGAIPMPEPSEFIAVEQNINNGVESKYFAVSKGFLGGLWAVLFGLAIICAEVVGVEAWDFAHWYQWIKVVGATLGTLAAAYGLYGRCVATAPIRFS